VRFAREREVHAVLHRGVSNALLQLRLEARTLAGGDDDTTPTLQSNGTAVPLAFATEEPSPGSLLPSMPLLRVFGQANATFIIAEGPDGLYMIDQHAAHERVLYDRFEDQLSGGPVSAQPLLEPAALELTPPQMVALEHNADLLRQIGFDVEPFGDTVCLVRTVPFLSRAGDAMELVHDILNELGQLSTPDSARERALAAMACKAAVKAGQALDVREMRELVEQLERTLRPSTCPHGRPTMIHLSHSQLEKEFGRR
jgi:DNA mismatch repair protein MutL